MTVSIVICTRNRAESLRATLASLAAAEVPADWMAELLIVDNGSTDHTAEVIRSAALPRLSVRHVVEPRAGQCFARNTGLRAAAGRVILFTDDDVRVSPRWIEGMARPILSGAADAIVGGVIFPPVVEAALAGLPPDSVVRRSWFASTEELDAAHPERLVGASMSFGRHVLECVPEFDTDLGPGALGFGDETLFSWRLREAGYRIFAALEVTVEHHLDAARLPPSAMLGLAKKMGATAGYLDWHWGQKTARWNGPRALWLRLKLALRRLVSKRTGWLEWEYIYTLSLARREQFQIESRRPRKYRPSAPSLQQVLHAAPGSAAGARV